ncbi:hypothetical protein ACFLZ6_02030 [Nanoarchaeota archaeon]
MKKQQLMITAICIALLSISATVVGYSFYEVKHVRDIPMDIKVGGVMGFTIEADALHFGTVMKAGCSKRTLTLKHEYDYPLKAMISISGDLETWTSVEGNDVVVEPGAEEEVLFKVCSPRDSIMNEVYTGTARVALRRV